MEKKNTILLTVIAVATLLVAVVGATFAYFTATVTDNRNTDADSGKTNLTTSNVAGTTTVANVDGEAGKFTKADIYPGHKEVAALSVTASGEEGSKSIVDIIYDITENGLGADNVKVRVYRSTTARNIGADNTTNFFGCAAQTEPADDGTTHFFETCTVTNDNEAASLGTLVNEVTLTGGVQSNLKLATETITVGTTDTTNYYYVVVEFVNQDKDQNDVMNTTLTGTIKVQAAA